MEKVNIGTIGYGEWGTNLARNFYGLSGATLRAVCDSRNDRASLVNRHLPGVAVLKDYKELLGDDELDAIAVATPASTHYRIAKEALCAGKHVFVEKPLALSAAHCKELIELSEKEKRVLMVGHVFVYNSAVNKLKEYILNGELGKIYYIYSSRLNLGRIRQDVNALWNFGPHDVSILLYLLGGEPVRVSARGRACIQDGIEDVVFMYLDFPDGVSAQVHISWLDPQKVRKMTVVGSKKMVVYDDMSADAKIQVYDKGITVKDVSGSLGSFENFSEFQLIHRAGDLLVPKVEFVEPLRVECGHFIECVREDKTPRTDGYDGLRVAKVLEAAQKSLKNNGIPEQIWSPTA